VGRLFALVGAGLLAPAIALADNGTSAFSYDLPTFAFTDIGTIGTTMLAVVAAIVVYSKVKGIINRG
jgi:hypothetical protein